MAIEPRVVQVNHAANAAHLTYQENALHPVENVISVKIRITSVLFVGQKEPRRWQKPARGRSTEDVTDQRQMLQVEIQK